MCKRMAVHAGFSMNHAVMMIPEVMRLPFTFGLSGAMHVAALSSVALPPPHVASVSPLIQVRLQHTFPVKHSSIAGLPKKSPESVRKSVRHNPIVNIAVPDPTILATLSLTGAQRAAKAVSINHTTHHSPDETSPTIATDAPASEALAVKTHPLESRYLEASVTAATSEENNVAVADTDQSSARIARGFAEADGTIESPFNVPRALYAPLRKYPEEARWERRTGQGSLGFRLKLDGSVDKEIKVLRSSGHADLDATAVESLRRWRFELPPGAAPSSWYRYPFRFGIS